MRAKCNVTAGSAGALLSTRALLDNGITLSQLIKYVLRRGKETGLSQLSQGPCVFWCCLAYPKCFHPRQAAPGARLLATQSLARAQHKPGPGPQLIWGSACPRAQGFSVPLPGFWRDQLTLGAVGRGGIRACGLLPGQW